MKDEVVVEKTFDDSSTLDKVWYIIVSNLILLVAGAFLGYLASANQWNWPDIVMLAVLIVLLALSILVFFIYRRIHGLTRQDKLQVHYIPRKKNDRSELFKEMQRHIETAEESIYILNYFTGQNEEEFAEEDIPETAAEARDSYYRALIQMAQRGKEHNFSYKRIVQIINPDRKPVWQVVGSKSYHTHFRQMLDMYEENPHTELFVRSIQHPLTFILIDSRCLLWQINEIVPDPESPNRLITQMHGMFVINGSKNDPMIREFVQLFDTIKARKLGGRDFQESDLLPGLGQGKAS